MKTFEQHWPLSVPSPTCTGKKSAETTGRMAHEEMNVQHKPKHKLDFLLRRHLHFVFGNEIYRH
jgi:hypothetical protein